MAFKVSSRDPRPPYLQIADALRADIIEGRLTAGDKLPSGRALAEEYGVAAMTVQHAVRRLRDEGLLVAWQGRGVYVTDATTPPGDDETDRYAAIIRKLEQLTESVADLDRRLTTVESEPRRS